MLLRASRAKENVDVVDDMTICMIDAEDNGDDGDV